MPHYSGVKEEKRREDVRGRRGGWEGGREQRCSVKVVP